MITGKLGVTPGAPVQVAMYVITETDPGDSGPTTKILQRVVFSDVNGNPVSPFQGQYRLTPVVKADGDLSTLTTDEYGNLVVVRGDDDPGDDKINDVKKVEMRYTYGPTELDGSASAVIKGGPGYVDHISISTDAAGAGIIYLRDSKTAGSGTIVKTIYIVASAAGHNIDIPIHAPFGTGIEIDFASVVNNIKVQAFWR